MNEKNVRITIYAEPGVKEKLVRLAELHEPRTTASGLGALLLKRGMAAYEQEQAERMVQGATGQ